MHDHTNATRDGQWMRNNPSTGRRNVIATTGSKPPHTGNDRLPGVLLKPTNALVYSVGGEDLTSGRVYFQDHGLDRIVLFCTIQLIIDPIDHSSSPTIHGKAGDDPRDVQHQHLFRGL